MTHQEQIQLLRDALEMAVRQNEHDMLMTSEECRKCLSALSASAASATEQQEPTGYVLVPVEPNEAMMYAGTDARIRTGCPVSIYKCMLDARPPASQPVQPVTWPDVQDAWRNMITAPDAQQPD